MAKRNDIPEAETGATPPMFGPQWSGNHAAESQYVRALFAAHEAAFEGGACRMDIVLLLLREAAGYATTNEEDADILFVHFLKCLPPDVSQ